MIKLNLIKYTNANALEATWKDVTETITQVPDPEWVQPEDDEYATAPLIDSTNTTEVQVSCVAYGGSQEALLRADVLKYGGELTAEDEELIAEVVAAYVPPPPPDPSIAILTQIAALESSVTPRRVRESVLTVDGKTWLDTVDAEIAALRAQLESMP